MNPHFSRNAKSVAGAAVLACASFHAAAQTSAATSVEPAKTKDLAEVTVTGNPLGAANTVAPSAVLTGDALTLRLKPTLGETLDGLPGVSSTYFGPNASRPIIRGMDGDRIRVLQNSGASVDASALSFDHAVPIDPLTTERIEVLRGPSALLYGGSAVGGVVNAIDNRIPREPVNDGAGGISGEAQLGYATGNREKDGGVRLETGTDKFGLHVDVFDRKTSDVRVPTDLVCEKPGSPGLAQRICNSASETKGGAVGGSLFFDHGYLGASVSQYRSDYGTVAEDEVTIGMRSNRYALEGAWRNPGGAITGIKAQFAHTDYRHTEFEGGEPGTTFTNRGNDFRIEARHAAIGPLEGVIGLQGDNGHFAAEGDEAFAPPSRTRNLALFALEEWRTGWGKLSFGARVEKVRVSSEGSTEIDRFVAGERNFTPFSMALGGLVNLTPTWQLTSNLASTQRAPKDYELYANGPHLATAAWETGNPNLGLEKSTSLDLGVAWKDGGHSFSLTGYAMHFSNYIGLDATGDTRGVDGTVNPDPASGEEALTETRYRGVRARFVGLEASGSIRLLGQDGLQQSVDGHRLDLLLRGDLVRATNLSSGEPLPRIAPLRLGASLAWRRNAWGASLGADYYAAQDRVPSVGQRETEAYTLVNASMDYSQNLGRSQALWYARLDNLTDKLAYSATSVLTTTAFPKAPLPGRSLKVGVKLTF